VKALAALAEAIEGASGRAGTDDQRGPLVDQIEAIESEAKAATPDPGKFHCALTAIQGMIRGAAVGAGASIITQGALALIDEALKHL
jgi:hypothetical protein